MSERAHRRVHQLLAEVLGERVRVLRADRVLLVDRRVVGRGTARSGKKNPGTVSLETFTNRGTPKRTAASSALNVAIRLLRKTVCGGLRGRLGDRRRVDHGVVAAHDRERVAGVGEVGLQVGGRAGRGRLEDGRAEVAAP